MCTYHISIYALLCDITINHAQLHNNRANNGGAVYLGSAACTVGGAVLLVDGPKITNMVSWQPGSFIAKEDETWDPAELVELVPQLYQSDPIHVMYKVGGYEHGKRSKL